MLQSIKEAFASDHSDHVARARARLDKAENAFALRPDEETLAERERASRDLEIAQAKQSRHVAAKAAAARAADEARLAELLAGGAASADTMADRVRAEIAEPFLALKRAAMKLDARNMAMLGEHHDALREAREIAERLGVAAPPRPLDVGNCRGIVGRHIRAALDAAQLADVEIGDWLRGSP